MKSTGQESIATLTGSILRFERASIHDGRGLRTVLFLKGCPLNCPWCSTPESRNLSPQRGYIEELCTLCGSCAKACPEQALTLSASEHKMIIDRSRCQLCFKCAAVCPQSAIKKYGFTLTVAETVEQIRKDEIFYFHSGGGLTISGGEPLQQPEFTAAVLEHCKKLGIHTAVESCLHVPFAHIALSLPWLDHLYIDLKQMDSRLHQLWLGEDNGLILENIKRVNDAGQSLEITVRLPLIPGFNDSDLNLQETVHFCLEHSRIKEIEVLPYHRLGSDTYRHLGLDYQCRDLVPPSQEYLEGRASLMRNIAGTLPVKTGSGLI